MRSPATCASTAPDRVPNKSTENIMRRSHLPLAFALLVLVLAGCASVPAPLQGQYSQMTPRDVVASQQRGMQVRWGGRIVAVDPLPDRTCFEVVSTGLDASGRPRWAADATGGRFIACRAGFYDPAIFQPDRELTVIGSVDDFRDQRIGEYEYRFPVVHAAVVYLWPVRERIDVIQQVPPPVPWWWY